MAVFAKHFSPRTLFSLRKIIRCSHILAHVMSVRVIGIQNLKFVPQN